MLPTYQKIINSLQERIGNGEYGDDDKLPSEAMLMEEFQTSRITVTRALKELELREIIYRVKGKGSFVKSRQSQANTSKIISLVLPHKEDFFSGGQQYTHQISKMCRERGYLCSVHYSEQSSKKEKQILLDISRHQVAGAIIYPISNRNIDSLSRMSIDRFPMVLLDRDLQELNLPVVSSDNFNGALEAVKHLIKRNHRKIAFVGAMDSDAVQQRYQGYCRALTENGIPIDRDLVFSDFSAEDEEDQFILSEKEAELIVKKILKSGTNAVFSVNDLVAYRLLFAAISMKVSVPDDLSVVGFDNLRYLAETRWNLTTVAQDFKSLAENSVELLISIIEGGIQENPEKRIIPTSFLQGNTTD